MAFAPFKWLTDTLFGKAPTQDFNQAALTQGTENKETAYLQSLLNNPSMVTPYGTSTYSQASLADLLAGNRPTLTQSLSPAEQAKLDQTNQSQLKLLDILNTAMPGIKDQLTGAFGLPGAPTQGYSPGYKPLNTAQTYGQMGAMGPIQRTLDFSGAPGMPVADPRVRDLVSQSLYSQGARFLDPQFRQLGDQLNTTLANQGIVRNPSDSAPSAWQNEQDALNRQRMQAYGDLADRSVLAGGNAMEQLYNMQMTGRQQGVGEEIQKGQFTNAAQNQGIQQILQALVNTANVGAQEAGLQNAGRSQAYNEYTTNRTMPLNMLSALLSNSQVNNPSFQPTQPTSITPAPIFQGAYATQQQNAANRSADMNFLGSLVNAGASMYNPKPSDRRLKRDIVPVGRGPLGLTLYEYTIAGRRERGVMADEVEKVLPEAVIERNGVKMVYYHLLGMPNGPQTC